MRKNLLTIIIATTVCLLIHFMWAPFAVAKIRHHLVLYGGISDEHIPQIANQADILILGQIRDAQLIRLKELNPRIIILKYQHAIGIHESSPDWQTVDEHEEWFVHGKVGERLREKTYGWYLMNITSEAWRSFRTQEIAHTTPSLFDGVFLDYFWDRFIAKFAVTGTNARSLPPDRLVNTWKKHMLSFLEQLRSHYSGLIFINGAHEAYIRHVDGCMYESFVHATWHSDAYSRDPSGFERDLLHACQLSRWKKTVLLHSGTTGDSAETAEGLFRYCYASYLLVANEYISFSFQPSKRRQGIPYFTNYAIDIGSPQGKFSMLAVTSEGQQLLRNGNFKQGFKGWQKISGNAVISDYTVKTFQIINKIS